MTADARLLIALDLDGTVLQLDGSIRPRVAAAIRDVAARHEVMAATGRSWEHVEPILDELGIEPAWAVCANGAVTMRRHDDGTWERFHVETFDPSAVLEQVGAALTGGRYMVELPDGERRYTVGMVDWDLDAANEVSFEELSATPVTRIVVASPQHDEQEFLRVVEDMGLHQVAYAVGWSAWLDIAPKGVDKSVAMERVRERLGIPRSRVIAVGDGRNDVELLQWASAEGRGVAMGQAPAEVVAAANETTADVEADGLADVLESIG